MSAEAAFTGGLSIVTTSTPPVTAPVTVSENCRLTSSSSARRRLVGHHRHRLYPHLGTVFDQCRHFDGGHRREMPADHFAISLADALEIGEIFLLVGEVPGHGGDVLGL